MSGARPRKWMKLDNAAKIYPAAMSRSWNALFRVSAVLSETVDPAVLQEALDRCMKRRTSFGGASPDSVAAQIQYVKTRLEAE